MNFRKRFKKVKNIIIVILMTSLIGLTIAYAALVRKLGLSKLSQDNLLRGKDFDIHFSEVSCSPTGNARITSPLVLTSSTQLSGLVGAFYNPGDSIVCTFYVENTGSYDAYLNGYLKQDPIYSITYVGDESDKALVLGHINYTLVYADTNTEPKEYDSLNINERRLMRLTLGLDTSLKEYPKNDVYISNFSTSMLYTQK